MDLALREVLNVARSVLSELDLESVLHRVLAAARELSGARYAALGVLDPSRAELERFITLGTDDETRMEIGALPRGRGVLGELIDHPVPLRLADVGVHPHSYGFPPGHPPMSTFLGVPVLVRGEPFGNLYLTEKADGEEFTRDDEEAVILLAEFAGVAIDHARRYTGVEQRRADLQRTVDALDATVQIARAIGGETDLNLILELVAKRGRALVTARALVIEHQRGDEMVVAAAAGQVPEGISGRSVDLRDSLAGAAVRAGRTLRLEEETNRRRFERHGLGKTGIEVEAGLVVPLLFRAQSYGALIALDRLEHGPCFTADDQRLLEAFAASAATAIATAHSVQSDRESQRLAAAEEERARWARELHDETLQNLAALRLGLASQLRTGDHSSIEATLRDAVEQLDSEIAGLRSLITDLRPTALDELGVEAAIEDLVLRARRSGLEVELDVDLAGERGEAAGRYVTEVETALYRITQESLTNARKHGGAHRAEVEIRDDDGAVRVHIHDDGFGFDPGAATSGFGLAGMRERAELLNGTLVVDSSPGQGTTVIATLPARRRIHSITA